MEVGNACKLGDEEGTYKPSHGMRGVIHYDDCVFLALDTLSTASLIGLRPFKTVIWALKYGAGNSMCISSDAVGPLTLSPSVEGK